MAIYCDIAEWVEIPLGPSRKKLLFHTIHQHILQYRNSLFVVLFCAISQQGFCQKPILNIDLGMISSNELMQNRERIARSKIIPRIYEKQILVALAYFPELSDIRIRFRFRRSNVLFTARPTVLSIFKRPINRTYVVTISDTCQPRLVALMFKNLPINAQIGAIGHEVSHLADFNSKNIFGMIGIGIRQLSRRYLDTFEYRTDSICISHGLGFQLLAWSRFIRRTMKYENWLGSANINRGPMLRERYMNPNTIIERIRRNKLYLINDILLDP